MNGVSYQYSAIDKGASEIRLMTLLPSVFGAEVRITIKTTVLSKTWAPEFEALSYTWGPTEDPVYIYIQEAEGESPLAVTQSLAEALQYLRYEDRSRVLWIDAICVDQSNISERGHQVVRMADIYPQASRVVIWLGPERDDSALVLRRLDALGSRIEVDWALRLVVPLSGDDYDQWLNEPLPFENDQKTLASIAKLLDRPWFKRLWIWQEVRLARSGAQILCGKDSMLWDTLRGAMLCLGRKLKGSISNLRAGIYQAYHISDYSQSQFELEAQLYDTRYAQCSDDRDRVYAVMNLTDGSFQVEPDYSKTPDDVFKSVVLDYVSMRQDLTMLRQCEMRKNKEARVPSWVPDWTTPNECRKMYSSRACLNTQAQARYHSENMLVVSGLLVATLDIIEQIPPESSTPEQISKIADRLMEGRTETDLYVAGGFVIDAVCRTLCCNRFLPRPAEGYTLLASELPTFQKSKEYMLNLMDRQKVRIAYWRYVDQVALALEGRDFFLTKNGYIGLGPYSIKPGDQACVILGCRALLILRPNDTEGYRVVGECYIDGFTEGEALLDALPNDWKRIARYFPDLGRSHDAWVNIQTGDVQAEDPRLGPLPAGWRIEDHKAKHAYNLYSNDDAGIHNTKFDPQTSPEALRARGVNLQEIRLV